jgi:hypothetical protein
MLAISHTVAALLMLMMMLQGASLTLAQRRGLIPKPDKLLSQEEWSTVHSLARQRNECSTANCAICLEPFKAEQQVHADMLCLSSCKRQPPARCAHIVVATLAATHVSPRPRPLV